MNHEAELLNAIIDTGDMPLALNSNVDKVFDVYQDIWWWVHSYYDKYGQLPDKDKVGRQFQEFEFLQTSGSLAYYIDEAHKVTSTIAIKNALIDVAQALKEHGPQAAIDLMGSVSSKIVKDTGRVKDVDLVMDYFERVEKLREVVEANENGRSTLGIPTGIQPIDFHFGGFQPGDLVIIAAWTSVGKSWFSLLLAVRAWQMGYRPLYISLEMNKWQMGYRVDTILTQGRGFRNSQLTHGRDIDPDEYNRWAETQFAGKHPFYLVTNEGLDEVNQNMIDAKINQYNPDLVIIDYHQLVDDASGGKTETEKAKNLSKDLKRIAVKNQVPIIDVAAVTLADGGHGDRIPELNEVAWSKQLAFDADLFIAMNRQPGTPMFEVAARKNRRGDMFAFNMAWDLDTGLIEELYD